MPAFARRHVVSIKQYTRNDLHALFNLANELRKHFGDRVIGPEFPLISRIRNFYIKSIMLKFERDTISIVKVKTIIREVILQFQTTKLSKGCLVQPDVDPY